jgi:hypothetical protein
MESVDGCIPLLFPRRRKFGDDEVQPQKRKPDGLSTVAEMVLAILEAEKAGMRPRDIRGRWMDNVSPSSSLQI